MDKATTLQTMHEGRAELEALLAEVGGERMSEPGVEGVWSVRDVLAHLTAYERFVGSMLLSELQRMMPTSVELYGREEVPPGIDDWTEDEYNAWVVEHSRDLSLNEVLRESRLAFDNLVSAVAAFSRDELSDPTRFPWLHGKSLLEILPNQSFSHYRMHLPAIRGWVDASIRPRVSHATPVERAQNANIGDEDMVEPLFKTIDCLRIPVPSLDAGLAFYRDRLGHTLIWRSDTAAGLRMPASDAEIVIHTESDASEVDVLVLSADEAASAIVEAGGTIVVPPFDIPIGRCVVVRDPWSNQLVLLDMSNGPLQTDENGLVTKRSESESIANPTEP